MIEVNQVSKRFGQLQAVDNVTFSVAQGDFLALLGPNGAGKTTLVEMIEGLSTPNSGTIVLQGTKTWAQHSNELRHMMGVSLQETQLVDRLTVRETLRLFGSFYGIGNRQCDDVLALLNLEEKASHFVNQLSGGQRQKCTLGLALIHRPQILILDEPTTGLDPQSRREIWEILQHLKAEKVTMILTTHYMEEAQTLCNRIVMMNQGRIIASGTFQELLLKYAPDEIVQFSLESPQSTPVLDQIPGLHTFDWDAETGSGTLKLAHIHEGLSPFLAQLSAQNLTLKQLECRQQTLDDLFLALAGRGLND